MVGEGTRTAEFLLSAFDQSVGSRTVPTMIAKAVALEISGVAIAKGSGVEVKIVEVTVCVIATASGLVLAELSP